MCCSEKYRWRYDAGPAWIFPILASFFSGKPKREGMRLTKLIFTGMLLLLLSGCSIDPCGSDKEAFLQRFDRLMTEVKAENLASDDSGWEEYDERFRAMVEECYDLHEAELTGGEKRRFWFSAMGYYKDRYGEGAMRKWLRKLGQGE